MKTLALTLLLVPSLALAEIKTQPVSYKHDQTACQGYLAWDAARAGRQPAVLVVPEWWGLNEYVKGRARQLASLGYVAFVADMYGNGTVTQDPQEAGKLATAMKNDRPLMRGRIGAALDTLKKLEQVEPRRIAAIGYCFGGTTVLELARSGADVAGVVSFHGGLDAPKPAEEGVVKARVLVLHGADDPAAPLPQVLAFIQEMRQARADYQVVLYGGAVHSFTNPDADKMRSKAVAYDAKADKRSWEAMRQFFAEVLGGAGGG